MDTGRPRACSPAARALAAGGLLLALGACGSGAGDDGRFNAGPDPYPLSCLGHQPDSPGQAYTSAENADTAAIFTMLKYYTANKAVTAYCDGKGPSKADRQWAQLYVDLGAQPANVAHILR